ncbi:acyl-CoA thioester hydrolase [Allocatelliglobosispora scoriae]|uniref:Acyl-CoA thioester hydrolase n=1 Tax=Allocatelliglobosispora scoriae TaxID=643052 RepID=A0A841BU04_9ACTN|nr:thioesterase family protein [Allocatelliglobosispora scoriae]MBB5871175.1 acyl-CoA thioester hydrolase [Allocatelliglobosispora scoriae]
MTSTMLEPAVEFGKIEQAIIHFDDLDASGLMHNARYALVLERVLSIYWARFGFSYEGGLPTSSDVVSAVREFSITYHVPIRGTGPVDVHFWVEKLGGSSAVYGFRFLSADHGTVHAEGRRVMVKFDPRTGRPDAWTPAGREVAAGLAKE